MLYTLMPLLGMGNGWEGVGCCKEEKGERDCREGRFTTETGIGDDLGWMFVLSVCKF